MTRFSFWGLFAAFFTILAAYWFWMRAVERREGRGEALSPNDRRRRPPGR